MPEKLLPEQTGIEGEPSEPLVVSFGIVCPHESELRLGGPLRDMRARFERLASKHRDRGWLRWTGLVLLRGSPDGRHRSWVFEDGVVDESRWEEAVAGIPSRFDRLKLSSHPWGELVLESPSYRFLGSQVQSLSGWVECPREDVDSTAQLLLEGVKEATRSTPVQTAFVHVDSVADPFTTIVTYVSRLSRDSFGDEIHGYYWAVFLTEGHMERLGGSSRVHRDAPCYEVKEIDAAGGGHLCLLTKSPLELDSSRVRAWRQFLTPVLRDGYPGESENVGVRASPLERPVWLFEGPPLPGATAFVLERGISGTSMLHPEWSSTFEDPECPTCWLYPTHDFDEAAHLSLLNAALFAWYSTGVVGRLYGVDGVLHRVTPATWDTDDEGSKALAFQVDSGSSDMRAAITLLVMELDELQRSLSMTLFRRFRIV